MCLEPCLTPPTSIPLFGVIRGRLKVLKMAGTKKYPKNEHESNARANIFALQSNAFYKSYVTYMLLTTTTLLKSVFWTVEKALWCYGGERVYDRLHLCIFFLRSSKLYWRLTTELKIVGINTLGHPVHWRLNFLSWIRVLADKFWGVILPSRYSDVLLTSGNLINSFCMYLKQSKLSWSLLMVRSNLIYEHWHLSC